MCDSNYNDFVYNMTIEKYIDKFLNNNEIFLSDEKTDLSNYIDNDFRYKVFIRTIKYRKNDFIYCADYVYTVYYDGKSYENSRIYLDTF